jgi:hypothetical protein
VNPTANQNRGTGASRVASILAFGILVAGTPGQEGQPSDKSTAAENTIPKAKTARPTGPASLARITSETCKVRCFASNLSPVYETVLPRGTVVRIGEEVGEFRRILLPLGVPGYVSKRFSTTPENGIVKTTRKLVSFRYRPTPKRRAEAPVQRMSKGTSLHYFGEVGDWWKVRFVTESAYVPIKAIELITGSNAKIRAAHAAFAAARDAEWQVAVASYGKRIKSIADTDRRTKQLKTLRATFHDEAKKPLGEQALKPILADVESLIAELPEAAPLLASARFLESAIQRQQVFVDAKQLLNAQEPPAPEPIVKITRAPKDALSAKLRTIGWLSYRPSAPGPSAYRLEKGGRIISYLNCSNLRYDLSLFHGVEIGVRGVRKRDAAVPYLDVQRIEVIGHDR